MNRVLSEVYFNRSLIWLVMAKLAGDDHGWIYLTGVVINLFKSFAAAMNER